MREKIRYRLKVLRSLKPFALGVKRFLLLNLVIGIFTMALGFIQPLFYKLFIDRVILKREFSLMTIVALGYLSVFAVNLGLSYLKNYSTNRLVNRVTFRVKIKILRSFFTRDFPSYDRQSVGDMKMRLDDDTACIASYAGSQTVDYVIAYMTLIISAVLLYFIEWRLALFSCVVIPLTFWLDHVIAKREAVVLNKQRENDQKMSSWLHASVQGWREIKALNLQKHEERQFARYIRKYAIFFGTWINYWVVRVLVIPKIKEEFLMQFSLYFFGGLLIIGGHFEIGSLLVFMQYYGILSNALRILSGTDADLLTATPQSDRMMEELSRGFVKRRGMQALGTSNRIEFLDVTFAYPDTEKNIIENLSFYIDDGERVGFTGKSGAGKTTVLNLMMGMLHPSSGTILFSEVNLAELSLNAIHRRVGFVMQENTLFNASIRENLLYGKAEAKDEELVSACRKAYIYDFIKSLPDGFDTVIGERGIKLSGGQKQRIVLARLFLRDVKVFIFDEATSALDQYSESIIQDAIRSIGQDKTIIVVAHRESSLALCDRVIAL
ncbi:MAG TPA: ABC transporter ATP-binding protein [Clostridia bacterium]|nr:ABC transporter ATP-binding protein [Clostridia bacterium]